MSGQFDVRYNSDKEVQFIRGKVKNLRVLVRKNRELVIRGSLPEGNNVHVLTMSGVRRAIESLSDVLGANIGEGNVYRLDLGTVLPVNKPVMQYTSHFVDASRYDMERNSNGNVTFKHKRRSLLFYDKRLEQKRKRGGYKITGSDHYLRYELQFKMKLKEQFNKSIYVKDLYSPNFFKRIVNWWLKEYKKVKKERLYCIEGVNNQKTFFKYLECVAMEELGGMRAVLDLAQGHKEAGKINRTHLSRIRSKIFKLNEDVDVKKQSELIDELDRKVERFARMIILSPQSDSIDTTSLSFIENWQELSPIGNLLDLLGSPKLN